MSRTLAVKVVVEGVEAQADRLEAAVRRGLLTLAAIDGVNTTVREYENVLAAGMIEDINLEPAYVRSKTDVQLATRSPHAEVTVNGDLTILGRYPLAQMVQIASARAKGDRSRGIPPGYKQAGVSVGIRRTGPTKQPKWFTMRLRAGRQPGTNIGVFVRTGPDKQDVKHIYGPAPYSLFRYQADMHLNEIAQALNDAVFKAIDASIEKEL